MIVAWCMWKVVGLAGRSEHGNLRVIRIKEELRGPWRVNGVEDAYFYGGLRL